MAKRSDTVIVQDTSPVVVTSRGSNDRSRGPALVPLWVRISAFLSLRAPNTKSTYSGILKEWCSFLGADAGTPESAELMLKATDLHAIAYKSWLDQRPGEKPRSQRRESRNTDIDIRRRAAGKKVGLEATLSNATISKKFAALRRIYRMLMASGLGISENPFDSDRVPAPPKDSGRKRPTEMLDFKLVKKILSGPDANTPKGLRDKAILSVLFGGGLRRSEVMGLRVGDVRKSSAGTVYLYLRSTKAKKDAQQALPTWAAATVTKLVQARVKQGAGAADYLFVGYTGQAGKTPTEDPVSPVGLYKLFKHYCRLAGAGKFVSPHSARATAITKLLADGIPHRQVQEFSRHSSIQMVELYDKRRIGVDENPAKDLDFD